MKKFAVYVLIALMVVFGVSYVACGGGGSKSNKEQPTAAQQQNNQNNGGNGGQTAEPTAEAQATTKSSGGGSSGSIGDVPVYPGATKTTSGSWSGSEAAIPAIGSNVNASDYSTVQYAMYETSDGAQDVFNWYKDKMSGWKDEGSFSGGSSGQMGGYAAWTKDNGKEAVWMTVGEESGKTTIGIFIGS